MPTGSKTLLLNSKQLLGFQDLGLRGFTALRNSHIEATQARWDVDGVFNNKLSMAGLAANTLQILGTSKSTDGLGHILNIQVAYRTSAVFQNTAATTYYVGLMYAEVPAGLRINPLTGKPQFDSYVEEVGFQAAPNSVVDNGNGTMTMVIDSVTETSVTNAGRIVRVWKVTPADGATTLSIAMEEVTSVFTGGQNKITTAAKFGQTTISTNPADYLVTVMGPRVTKNTDLSVVTGVVFIGTVVGNGAVPATFSNTNQTLLKTFQDATQVTYAPIGWLSPGATTVQLALDTVVIGLADTVSAGTSGASKIGVYASSYDTIAAGGIGNVADGTYTTGATVTNILTGINAMAKRRQSFVTKNDGLGGSQLADDISGTSLGPQGSTSRPTWLRTLSNPSSSPYTILVDPSGAGQGSYFMGEFNDPTQATLRLRKTAIKFTGAGGNQISFGKWQRVWLDCGAGVVTRFGGVNNVQAQILEDFGIGGQHIVMDANVTPTAVDGPLNWRNGIVKANPSDTPGFTGSTIEYGSAFGGSGWMWQVMEKLLVYGTDSTQLGGGTRVAALRFNFQCAAPLAATTVSTQGRPLVYRDCVFICQDTGSQGLILVEGTQSITFENCKFFDIAGRTYNQATFFVNVNGGQVHLKNCTIFSPEGQCFVSNQASNIVMEDCSLIAGIGGSSVITAPQVLMVSGGDTPMPPVIRDCRVYLGTANFRANASATATPLMNFSGTTVIVSNLSVKVDSGVTDLGWAKLLDCNVNSQTGQGCMGGLTDITIDCNQKPPSGSSSNPLVSFTAASADSSRLAVDRFLLRNTNMSFAAANNQNAYVNIGIGVVATNWLVVSSAIAPSNIANRVGSLIKITGQNNTIRDLKIGRARYGMASNNGMIWCIAANNRIIGLTGDETFNINNGSQNQQLLMVRFDSATNHCVFAECDITTGADCSNVVSMDGRDNTVRDCVMISGSNGNYPPIMMTTGRRNKATGNDVHYNGSLGNPGIYMTGPDCLTDGNTIYRTAGATAHIINAGAGAINGDNILSTTL